MVDDQNTPENSNDIPVEMTDEARNAAREEKRDNFRKAAFLKKHDAQKAADKKKFTVHTGERIAKVLARAGIASRREVERLIGLGKIKVNGRILDTPATLIKPDDQVTVDGKPVGKAEPTRVWRYHKPVGLVTTHSDPQDRPTVFANLPEGLPRVISVGRLDLNSEGLLLLTNDGGLARALELPSSGWVRTYRVRALGRTTQEKLDRLKDGLMVEGVHYGSMDARLDKAQEKADGRANLWLTVSLTEGKNREVRKVLEAIGLKVNRLIRLAYGPFQLGDLPTGEAEEVGPRVIRELLSGIVPLDNLPLEGASQTADRPRRDRDGDRPSEGRQTEGRRGGGDRFGANRAGGEKRGFGDKKPFGGAKSFGDKKPFGDRSRSDRGDNAGWRPKFTDDRDFKERDFDHRPRFEGDGEARDRKPRAETSDRQFSDRPRRDFGDKPRFDKPRFDKPRGEGGGADRPRFDKPRRDFGDKPRFDKPRFDRPAGDRPSSDRPDRGGFGDKPRGDFKPRGDRPERGGFGDKPRGDFKPRFNKDGGDRPDRGGFGDKPRGDFKPRGDRPDRGGFGDKPRGDFKPRFNKDGGDRPERGSFGDKPRGDFKPRGDRPDRGGFGDKPRSDFKPRFDKSGGDRPEGAGPSFGGKPSYGGKPSGGRPSFSKPGGAGPRSSGPRSAGPRSGGPSSGGPRKPRGE